MAEQDWHRAVVEEYAKVSREIAHIMLRGNLLDSDPQELDNLLLSIIAKHDPCNTIPPLSSPPKYVEGTVSRGGLKPPPSTPRPKVRPTPQIGDMLYHRGCNAQNNLEALLAENTRLEGLVKTLNDALLPFALYATVYSKANWTMPVLQHKHQTLIAGCFQDARKVLDHIAQSRKKVVDSNSLSLLDALDVIRRYVLEFDLEVDNLPNEVDKVLDVIYNIAKEAIRCHAEDVLNES